MFFRTFRYFNDLYSFCLDTFQWTQLKPIGQMPTPRSAAPIVTSQDGSTLFIINGYSKENDDKGVTHTDVFTLTQGIFSLVKKSIISHFSHQMNPHGNLVKSKSVELNLINVVVVVFNVT